MLIVSLSIWRASAALSSSRCWYCVKCFSKLNPLTLWLNFLGERTVSMLYLRQTCLSSIWYYCLCQLHTITINAMLHGLRQMDSHLGTAMRKPFSCITIYVKKSPFITTCGMCPSLTQLKMAMPTYGDFLSSCSCRPQSYLSGAWQDSVVPVFVPAIMKDSITLSLLTNVDIFYNHLYQVSCMDENV